MTWQVPGAKVEIAELPVDALELSKPPDFAVRIELGHTSSTLSVLFSSDTALALAAILVDAAHHRDELAANELQQRTKRLTGFLNEIRKESAPASPEYVRYVAEGYASDLEGH